MNSLPRLRISQDKKVGPKLIVEFKTFWDGNSNCAVSVSSSDSDPPKRPESSLFISLDILPNCANIIVIKLVR